jgi:GAF domain-containing protein
VAENGDTFFETTPGEPTPSDVLAKSHALETILESVVRAPVPVFADVCVVTAVDSLGRSTSRAAGDWDDPFMTSVFQDIAAYKGIFWSPLAAWCADPSTAEPVLMASVDDAWIRANFAGVAAQTLCGSIAPASAIVVPLCSRNKMLGVIMLCRTSTTRAYGTADLTFAKAVAHRISATLDTLV